MAAILALPGSLLPHNVAIANDAFIALVLLIVDTGIVYCGWRFAVRSHITTSSL